MQYSNDYMHSSPPLYLCRILHDVEIKRDCRVYMKYYFVLTEIYVNNAQIPEVLCYDSSLTE